MSTAATFNDWNDIRSQFEQRLGKLTIEFAKLEVDLGCAIGSLVCSDVQIGHSVSSDLSFRAKLALLATLYRGATDDALYAEFDMWRKRAEQVEASRNRLIHSFYWPDTSAGQLVRYKTTARPKKGLSFQTEPVTAENLDSVLHELEQVVQGLIALMMKHNPDYTLYGGRFWGTFTVEKTKPQQVGGVNQRPAEQSESGQIT